MIVERILGGRFDEVLIVLIGLGEVVMGIWVLSNWKRRLNAWLQISLVLTMNILETLLAPDLLLWGHFNIVWACAFLMIVWFVGCRREVCHA